MAGQNGNQSKDANVLEFVDETIDDETYRNLIFPKRVYCPNKIYGCKYLSAVQHMPEHLKTCKMIKNRVCSPILKKDNALDMILGQVSDVSGNVEQIYTELNKFQDKISQIEKSEIKNKAKIDIELENIVGQVNAVAQHLHEANSRLQSNIVELHGICKEVSEKQAKSDEKTSAIYQEIRNITAVHEMVKQVEKMQVHNKILTRSMKTKLEELESSEALNARSTEILIKQIVREAMESLLAAEAPMPDAYGNRKRLGRNSAIVSHLQQSIFTTQHKLTEPLFFFDGNLYNILVHELKIKHINQKMSLGVFECESEVFALPMFDCGAQVYFKLHADGWIHISLVFRQANQNRKAQLDLPVFPRFTFILKDRSKHPLCRDKIQSDIQLFNTALNYHTFYRTFVYINPKWLTNPVYNVQDRVTLEIHVESPSLTEQAFSRDGVLMWKICNYRKKKQIAQQELVFYQLSPYFYTGPRGYRVQVRVWLNNYDQRESKILKFDVCFCSGEFDRWLPSSFPHKTTVTIFNHSDGNKHMVQSMEANVQDKPAYSIDLAPRQEVEEGGYILEDTLFYKVVIQAL